VVVLMGVIAFNPMLKAGYDVRLASGVITAGGTLGILIPPSTIMVIYGIMTETNIGKLFAAGILPGILATFLLCLAVQWIVWTDPTSGPRGERSTWGERLAAIGFCMGGTFGLELARDGAPLKGVVTFHSGLQTQRPAAGQIKAKILINTGADDPLVPFEQVKAFADEMTKAGADWQIISYGGTKHSFTNPDADSVGMPALGYNKLADERSWRVMKSFFEEIFA